MRDLIKIKVKDAIDISDKNCDAIASELAENRLINEADESLYHLDRRDGILKNDPLLNHAREKLAEIKKQNTYQYQKDNAEKTILDDLIPLFEEHIPDEVA